MVRSIEGVGIRAWTNGLALVVAMGLVSCGGDADRGEGPELTSSQEQALETAQQRTDREGYGRTALVQTLEFEDGFSKADATFAANNVSANWKEEAVERAQIRVDRDSPYLPTSLIAHLKQEGFSRAEATFAVDNVCGLESARC